MPSRRPIATIGEDIHRRMEEQRARELAAETARDLIEEPLPIPRHPGLIDQLMRNTGSNNDVLGIPTRPGTTSRRPGATMSASDRFITINNTIGMGGIQEAGQIYTARGTSFGEMFYEEYTDKYKKHSEDVTQREIAKGKMSADEINVALEKYKKEKLQIDNEEEMIVNIEELADHYATIEFIALHPTLKIEDNSKLYADLIVKHTSIISKFKRVTNEK